MASFSPDGQSVAFAWNGPAQDNWDIYVRKIGSPSLRRVTSSPLQDYSPSWSPDGESIAFLRKEATSDFAILLIVPAHGGSGREIARISTYFREPVASLSWTPDGNWFVVPQQEPFGLFLISVKDGTQRRLTRPPVDQFDLAPAVSRDGRMLAFVRGYGEGLLSVYLLPLTPTFLSGGEPQPVPGFFNVGLFSPQWTPDGKELLFVANPQTTGMAIWRIRVPEPGKPLSPPQKIYATRSSRIRLAAPSIAAHRLIYSTEVQDRNIWITPLGITSGIAQARRIVTASQNNSDARISPDGSRIVYQSSQFGATEIWASNLDGTHTVQLTNFGMAGTGSAVWAPDGRRIAFDSRVEGRPTYI
jgi:Tol biopolymer transport system component